MNIFRMTGLKNLKVWQKLVLLGIAVAPAALVPFYYSYTEAQSKIDFARTEVRGINPSHTVLKIMNALQRHRGLSANVLGGNTSLAASRSTTEAEVAQQMAEMDVRLQGLDDKPILDAWGETKRATGVLMQAVGNRTIAVGASNDEHSRILAECLALLDKTIDYYKLSQDPDAHTYFLVQATLVHLAATGESFGQMRAYGTALLRVGADAATDAELSRMAGLIREGRTNYERASSFLRKAFREAPRLATEKSVDDLKAIKAVSEQGLNLAQKEILDADTYTLDSAEYLKAMTDVIEAQFKFTVVSLDSLRAELSTKIADLQARQRLLTGVILSVAVLAFFLGYTIVRSIVNEREAVATKIKLENDALNESLIDIMRSVSKLAQGDLRVRAPVREDVTGALSDAINSMAESTARALFGVNASSEAVRTESKIGRETVLSTAKGMNEVRGTIQETGKRIKRLGERSQEIGGIVKLIDDIAERTSVLALNANMQAAVAGEAGRGFRVVADEVQRLAERSKEATDQIAKLVAVVQSETNDTIATMERAIGEVVKGGELAERAAAQVSGLEKLGGDLHDAVQAFTLPEEARAEVQTRRAEPPLRRAA
jgi:twitching motility protein PilJ